MRTRAHSEQLQGALSPWLAPTHAFPCIKWRWRCHFAVITVNVFFKCLKVTDFKRIFAKYESTTDIPLRHLTNILPSFVINLPSCYYLNFGLLTIPRMNTWLGLRMQYCTCGGFLGVTIGLCGRTGSWIWSSGCVSVEFSGELMNRMDIRIYTGFEHL